MKSNAILLFIFSLTSCSYIPSKLTDITKNYSYQGCWASFDQSKIINTYCSGGLNKDSKFLIGSLSKMFVAAGILKLEEAGSLATRDTIVEHFPELNTNQTKAVWEKLRLFHLIKHRSGAPDLYNSLTWQTKKFKESISMDEILLFLNKASINKDYVGRYNYSNTGYIMLGETIRRVSKEKLGDFYRWNFFMPLKMKDTFIGNDIKNFVLNDRTKNLKEFHITEPFADGNLISTTSDMVAWGQAILNRKGIFKENYSYIKYLKPSLDSYAYGLIVFRKKNKEFAMHSGSWIGYKSSFMLNLTDKTGIIYLSHKMNKENFERFTKLSSKAIFLGEK
jgi:CubicO group peptidase (beta-lactamase class C family)